MRCVTFEEISTRARLTGWCLCLATLLASGAADAQDATRGDGSNGGDQTLVPQPAASCRCATGGCTAGEASCGCESVTGCSDYAAALSAACESCTTSCAGLGGGPRLLSTRPRPAIRLLDYAFGDSCTGGDPCTGSACHVDGGCGQFWKHVASGRSGSTVGLLGSMAARSSRDKRLGAGRLCGCGVLRGGPGAGYVGHREPPVRCGMPAPTYPVPYPVPQHVGYTRFTYPPMMPHHSLPHYRHTYSYRHAPGLSRTTVHWRSTTLLNALAKLHHIIELPR